MYVCVKIADRINKCYVFNTWVCMNVPPKQLNDSTGFDQQPRRFLTSTQVS